MRFLLRCILWVGLLPAALALLVAALFGAHAGYIAAIAALGVQLAASYWQLAALRDWLAAPQQRAVPQGYGAWEEPMGLAYALHRQQTSRQQRLNNMLERFQSAAAAMPDGIVILDGADQIEWCNPVAVVHFGFDPERDRGHPIHYLVRQSQFIDYLQSQQYGEPLRLRSTRSAERVLSIQVIPFGDDQKLLLSRDVTRFEQLEVMRRDFVANVSHELRTPLTVINGFLEMFADGAAGDPAQFRDYCGMMLEQSQRMMRLVEALLTLSRLENDQNPPQTARVDVPAMLPELLRQAEPLSRGRHDLRLDVRCDAPLEGNPDELHSAFSNLLTNAIRYTPEGGAITLVWERCGDELCYRVKDTGIGIEPQHINRLTERFYRVDKSRSRATGGTGLGLSIVKHVMNRHQGQLRIESQPGKGSTFSCCFPAPPDATVQD